MPQLAVATDQSIFDPRSPVAVAGRPRPPVLPALTSLRFFAALHVALSHLAPSDPAWGPLGGLIRAGYTGVSFFFVLSGFVLTYSHAREFESGRGSIARFYFARFARIYPVYFVITLLAGILNPSVFHNKIHILAFLADFLMVQAWSIRMVNFFNTIAWTLSCEAFFYLIFPFVLLRLRPRSIPSALRSLFLLWALAVLAPLCSLLLHHPTITPPGSRWKTLLSRLPFAASPSSPSPSFLPACSSAGSC